MKGLSNAKLIFFHQANNPLCKQQQQQHQPGSLAALLSWHQHRFLVVAVVSFFAFASLFITLLTATTATTSSPPPSKPLSLSSHTSAAAAPPILSDALVHYAASAASAGAGRMPEQDLRAVASAIRRRAPCNLLVFGLGHETLLWRSLNHGGRTVVLDENEYRIARFEEEHPGSLLEAYDVAYTTRVSELAELLASARAHLEDECRPVQNLLFSDCRLGINDLPNQLYDVSWDVVLVDGPRGYAPTAPGRMSAIFTAAVMARTAGRGRTDVLVHDYDREVERLCSEEFLCPENLVSASGQLAHFVIRGGGAADRTKGFCKDNRNGTLPVDATAMAAGTS
ncbi:protein IRREGULAR XYLEM 15 [Iris pallida]|uniref:Protein IRREGULAR XYLEM 15 n=1 Tax=Iris pallida TaxID=29817 RepID=A0AAX6DST8_IRIPA|nr:protein IRREGULAR XYLEM 15 [Iris pallida]